MGTKMRHIPIGIVYLETVRKFKLNRTEQNVLTALCLYANSKTRKCYPSIGTISKWAGHSNQRTVRATLATLAAKHLITIQRGAGPVGAGKRTHIYTIRIMFERKNLIDSNGAHCPIWNGAYCPMNSTTVKERKWAQNKKLVSIELLDEGINIMVNKFNQSLFEENEMKEFATDKEKKKVAKASKTSTRALRLLQLLHYESTQRHYDYKMSIDIPVLKRLADKLGRRELYAMIWCVAHNPPRINDREAVLSVRFISYHSNKITASKEYEDTINLFDEAAMERVEGRIDEYVPADTK